jgi:hypothetical protein
MRTPQRPGAVDAGDLAVEIIQAVAQLFQRRQKRGDLFTAHYIGFHHASSLQNIAARWMVPASPLDHAPHKGVNAARTTNTFLPRFPL